MRNFRNNFRRSRYKNHSDRNNHKNENGSKMLNDLHNGSNFIRKNASRNNHNASKLVEKYSNLALLLTLYIAVYFGFGFLILSFFKNNIAKLIMLPVVFVLLEMASPSNLAFLIKEKTGKKQEKQREKREIELKTA